MVGVPGRSRGCLICRQRKIKCDEALPECSQCRRSRRQYTCTGSLTGLFISITTSKNVNQRAVTTGRSRDSRSRSPRLHARFETSSASPGSSDGNELDHCQAMVMADQALDTPSLCQLPLHQPSHSGALEQLFSSHFIRSFGSARHTPPYWLERLPDMLVSSVSETVKDSIRAAVILFYGILTSNVPMQTEANRFYAKALHGLRSRLQNETRSIGDCSTNTSTTLATDCTWVCAPIMMCYFEMMANSSPDGWISHIEAAASMLESRGPEDCRLGMRHQIFLTVRLFMLFVSMTTNKVHPFTSELWTTIPFEKSSKNLWDELVDILLLLPGRLVLSEEFLKKGSQDSTGIKTELQESVLGLVSALDNWRHKYPNAEDTAGISRPHATALVAVFDAANVIAYSLLLLVSPPAHHQSHNCRTLVHAQAVLSADAYIDSKCVAVAGGGSLLMAFALKVLSVWAPLQDQRDYAIRKLRTWDSQETSNGRRGFAAPVLMLRNDEFELTNVYYANVATEIFRRTRKSITLI